MLKYALTGNIAAGKSSVERLLIDKGYAVFDTDKIAHDILENSPEINEVFKGYDVFTDGKIDRIKLAKVVFSDSKELKKLENIIHPKVKEEILKIFEQNYKEVFISVPQLFEAGLESLFDKIIFISAKENIRLERLMKRNNLTKEDAQKRLNAQLPEAEKIKKSDIIIENNGTIEDLELSLKKII